MSTFAIAGSGGHGKDLAGIAWSCGYNEVHFYDDDPHLSYPSIARLDRSGIPAVVGVNDSKLRATIVSRLQFVHWARLVHPQAIVPARTSLGVGSVIAPGAVVTVGVIIGSHSHINVLASVSQGSTLGDYVTLGPGANVAGDVTIGNGTFVGVGASIVNGITIGRGCTIGAGAVVIRDVPDGETVVGVPARSLEKAVQ